MFKLKKKAFNKNRSDLAKRIKTAIIIKKLTIALKLGLPIRGRIKDCKFIWTAFTRTVPRKTNPKSTSEPNKLTSVRLNEGNCKIHTLQRMENLCKAVKGKDLPTNNLQIKMS